MTLLEVLVAVLILGILLAGLSETMNSTLRSLTYTRNQSRASGSAHLAVLRMTRFVAETDAIVQPQNNGIVKQELTVADRLLDLVNNTTRSPGSDGKLDADTDADGLINEGSGDAPEFVNYTLDKSDPDNWKLTEEVPDYTTADLEDTTMPRTICDHVADFQTQWLSAGVVRIYLRTRINDVDSTIETRVRSRLLTPKAIFP